ncbi:MAG: MerR family transcriptional regulator [Muribaculaceae bacterium]|nr:MerR family transcriptional regulator [Muribaculaceae bacterium]
MDSIDKKYYKISEVAEILNLPASTLRFWENKFTIIKPKRNAHGTRFYTPANIDTISMIHYLVKERGFKLDAAQEQIKSNPDGIAKKYLTVARLKRIREKLVDMLDGLNALR